VLGKYVPPLAFLDVLVSNETVTEMNRYYQRLVARDHDEAAEIVEDHLKTQTLGEVFDEVLVPALCYAKQDRRYDSLTQDDAQFIFQSTREVVEDLDTRLPQDENGAAPLPRARILGCPARDEVDEIALLMFQQLFDPAHYEVDLTRTPLLTSEVVSLVVETGPALICIGAVPPGGLAQARYLCKRLRARFPDLKIVVGRWGFREDTDETLAHLRSDGVDYVGTSLRDTRDEVMRLVEQGASLTPEAVPA
jgi:hypothetical protein